MKKQRIAIGLIGLGSWGTSLIDVFSSHATIAACSTRKNNVHLSAFKRKYPSARIYFDIPHILRDSSLHAVIIATPPETHYALAKKALEHGKHVFVEKPMALKTSEVRKLITISKQRNLVLFCGYTFLYHPIAKKVKDLLRKDPARSVVFSWNKFGSFRFPGITNLLCHDIALAVEWFGSLSKHKILTSLDIAGVEDIVIATSSARKTKLTFSINRVHHQQSKEILLQCRKHSYLWADENLLKLSDGGKWKKISVEKNRGPLSEECADFIQKVRLQKHWLRAGGAHDEAVSRFFAARR
jgi:predicted dehydrogenase